jgi:dihydrofolate reductase
VKTQYYTACSIDGFIATDDHSLQWLFQLGDVADTGYGAFIAEVGALAMGASTYQWMLRNVINPPGRPAGVWPYQQPTWVFTSRTWPVPAGADVRFVRGDVRPVHAQMVQAAATQNIWLVGGGDLVGQFCDAGLVDELILTMGSVTLGSGKPLLPRQLAFPPLELLSAKAIGPGFAELRYRVPRRAFRPAQLGW